jgi:hypothetical protein
MALGRPIQLTGNIASKTIRVLATDNQTVFTVIGGYRINQLGVFRNGVRLSNNTDFQALDGVTVTLVNAATETDEVLFQIQDDFKVADAIVSTASSQTIYGDLSINGDLYYQGSSSGILTTGGDGSNLTGVVNSLIAGDNISVSSATGNVTITGLANTSIINSDSLNVIGITTVTTFNATTGSFSGNVSIGGTLTYEDVSNVDSVGLITARSGIHVGPTSGIGITLNPNGNITAAGQVTSTGASYGFTSNATSFPFTAESTLGNQGKAYYAKHTSSGGASSWLFYGENNTGEVFSVTTGGSITAAGDCSFANNRVSAFTSSDNGYVRINNSSGTTVIDLNGINGTITANGYSMASLTQL